MNNKVSIIMATYNRTHFIEETLLSVQNQTFLNWECLIIDDGGTDDTENCIKELLDKDKRFKFLKRPDNYKKGLPGSRNYGLDNAKGEYVVFFDDDDLVDKRLLNIAMKAIEVNNVSYCHYQKKSFEDHKQVVEKEIVYGESFLISKDNLTAILQNKIGMASCTVLWNKKCFKEIRFKENLMYAEEWECYSRIILEGFLGVSIPNVLYFNRKHLQSNTAEFYRNDSIRRASKAEAILLVIENLQDKNLLSMPILRYFITMSSGFKEFNLFPKIIHLLKAKITQKIKWKIFYYSLPLRMPLYKMKKSITKN